MSDHIERACGECGSLLHGSCKEVCDSPELAAMADRLRLVAIQQRHAEYGNPTGFVTTGDMAQRNAWAHSDRGTLLRMVDELSERVRFLDVDRTKMGQKIRRLVDNWRETQRERDDLRAKLSDAARIHVESEVNHAYRVKELEAKLAEAENACIGDSVEIGRLKEKLAETAEIALKNGAYAHQQEVRAEAAEARVRELEVDVERLQTQLEDR